MTLIIERRASFQFSSQKDPRFNRAFSGFAHPDTIREHGDEYLEELKKDLSAWEIDVPPDLKLNVEWE